MAQLIEATQFTADDYRKWKAGGLKVEKDSYREKGLQLLEGQLNKKDSVITRTGGLDNLSRVRVMRHKDGAGDLSLVPQFKTRPEAYSLQQQLKKEDEERKKKGPFPLIVKDVRIMLAGFMQEAAKICIETHDVKSSATLIDLAKRVLDSALEPELLVEVRQKVVDITDEHHALFPILDYVQALAKVYNVERTRTEAMIAQKVIEKQDGRQQRRRRPRSKEMVAR